MLLYGQFSDVELIAALKLGDRSAFAEIFDRYSDLLYVHAYNKLRHKEEAKDMVQDVFIKLWDKHRQLEIKSNLSGYLYVMVRNSIFSLISHKNVINNYSAAFCKFRLEGEAVTDHLIREKQLAKIIEAEIAALPPRMREVFELRRKEHLSNKQIALRLNISELTVSDQMKKALRQLRLRMGLVLAIAGYLLR